MEEKIELLLLDVGRGLHESGYVTQDDRDRIRVKVGFVVHPCGGVNDDGATSLLVKPLQVLPAKDVVG